MNAPAILRPLVVVDCADQLLEDLFAFAADDHVDPRRLREHLLVHEGGVHPAENSDSVRAALLCDLEDALGRVDRRGDRSATDHVGLQLFQPRAKIVV